MSQSVAEHRREAAKSLNLAVMTVSDTQDARDGHLGRTHRLPRPRPQATGSSTGSSSPTNPIGCGRRFLKWRADPEIHAILVTGGTGISPRDQTFETVSALLTKPLPGYGELFRMLSFAEIGPACLLSRAVGGLIGEHVLLVMPGSLRAVELAMTKIILPRQHES